MRRTEALEGNPRWTKETAKKIIPILIWCAQQARTITYASLDRELVRREWGHHVHAAAYGYPAGTVGTALIELGEILNIKIPPLNALIVNAKTGIPGSGCDYYLDRYVRGGHKRKLSERDRKALAEETINEVFHFNKWRKVLNAFNMKQIDGQVLDDNEEDDHDVFQPALGGWGQGESANHKKFKKYICKNPALIFGHQNGLSGVIEYPLPSGDKVDVLFTGKNRVIAVEVKAINANDSDVSRGIFQCVKYRSVLRAQQKVAQKLPNGESLLVIQRPISTSLVSLADLLNVEVRCLDIKI